MKILRKQKTNPEDHPLIKQAIKRLSGMKAEDIFPEKNKQALESLIRAGLL